MKGSSEPTTGCILFLFSIPSTWARRQRTRDNKTCTFTHTRTPTPRFALLSPFRSLPIHLSCQSHIAPCLDMSFPWPRKEKQDLDNNNGWFMSLEWMKTRRSRKKRDLGEERKCKEKVRRVGDRRKMRVRRRTFFFVFFVLLFVLFLICSCHHG